MTKQDSVGLHYTDRRTLADLHFLNTINTNFRFSAYETTKET